MGVFRAPPETGKKANLIKMINKPWPASAFCSAALRKRRKNTRSHH